MFLAPQFPQSYSYLCSLHYIAFFVLGICTFYYSSRIRERFGRLRDDARVVLLGAAILIYSYPGKILTLYPGFRQWIDLQLVADWTTAIGAFVFIVFALDSAAAGKILQSRPALWLGGAGQRPFPARTNNPQAR